MYTACIVSGKMRCIFGETMDIADKSLDNEPFERDESNCGWNTGWPTFGTSQCPRRVIVPKMSQGMLRDAARTCWALFIGYPKPREVPQLGIVTNRQYIILRRRWEAGAQVCRYAREASALPARR